MSQMKYDASTLGNHDFDAGLGGFVKQLPHATFPFLNANYIFDNTPLQDKVQRYKLFQYGHVKIGVFGLGIELAGLVPTDLYGGIQYTDPVLAANKIAEQLKYDHKCDMVICLSHLGYKYTEKKVSDIILAETSKNIDLILGGHTHTFFDKPEEYKNAAGEKVLINQVGWAGIYLGRIDFYFEEKRKAALVSGKPQLIS
jgi:5'-nucleotidase